MALALGMAHVIVAEGLGAAAPSAARCGGVAAFTPEAVEEQTDVPADDACSALARAVRRETRPASRSPAASPRRASRRSRAGRRGQPAQLRRRQRRPDGALRPHARRSTRSPRSPTSQRLVGAMDAGRRRACWSCTAPIRPTRCPRGPASPPRATRCRSRSSLVERPRRDRASSAT